MTTTVPRPTAPQHGHRHRLRLDLLGWNLVAVAVVAVVGGLATDTAPGSFYDGLRQPSWNPPDALFAPVWSALYVTMAVAAWMVALEVDHPRRATALTAYGIQLVLNLGWTLVFFQVESALGALLVIAGLLVAIVVTMARFAHVSRPAALLLVPFLAWVGYATALTSSIARLN